MSDRTIARLAWAVLAFVLVSTFGAEALALEWRSGADVFAIVVLSFPVVGALIVSRRPRNTVGWTMLGIGVGAGISEVFGAYAHYGLTVRPGSLPRPDIPLALNAPMWVPFIGLPGTFLILLFPDGRVPSRGWRPWAWFCGLAMVLSYLAILLQPYKFVDEGYPNVTNPFGVAALEPVANALFLILLLIPIAIVGCAVALVRRFRRSQGRDRLQLKWLAAAAGTMAVVYGAMMMLSLPFVIAGLEQPAWMESLNNIGILPFFLLPIAVGIAILKHRLYDIDVIINRALVYGTLTVALTTAYIVVIAVLQLIVRPFAGQSQLAVAGSTLAVAALFQPARVRTQAFIDRRFYRSKFDAGKTLDGFSQRLRDEVNLETLTADLLAVVDQTMRPAHRSLWLRDAGTGNPTAQPRA
jgi:hypothetical protein